MYQPRALCAVAPHLLLGLRCEEEVWRGFRAPPRAQVPQVPRPSSCKYRLYPKGRYLECETLTTRDRPRRANERVVRRASTRARPRNSGECVFGCEQILNLIEETLSGCTLYKTPALYLNA